MTFKRGRFLFLGIVSILVLGALVSHRILGFNSAAVAQDKSDLIISYDIVEGDETVASCLATRISDHKWITAKHCIPGDGAGFALLGDRSPVVRSEQNVIADP